MKFFKVLWFLIYLFISLTISFSQVPTPGLVAYWPFNGNANDESGNGWNGTVQGASLTTDRFGNSNKAYYFSGTDNQITTSCPGVVGSNPRTISIWVKTSETSNVVGCLLYTSPGNYGAGFQCKLNDLSTQGAGIEGGNSFVQYQCNVGDNAWHHYVWVVPEKANVTFGDVKIYRDGSLLTTVNVDWGGISLGRALNTAVPSDIRIGYFIYNSNTKSLDDVRIYKRALSDAEIQALYTEPYSPSTPYSPNLSTPLSGSTGLQLNPSLHWNSVVGATSYRLQVSTNSSFSTTILDQSNITAVSYFLNGLSSNTSYYWRVNASNSVGTSTWSLTWSFTTILITGIEQENVPVKYSLGNNYPNPFNPSTRIEYSIPENSFVSLKIYDAYGKEIESLVSKNMSAGIYSINWIPKDLPSGVYHYKLQVGSFSEMKKMIYIK